MTQGLKVTMKKHPSAFKLTGHLAELLTTVGGTLLTLYEGTEREKRKGQLVYYLFSCGDP